MKQTSLLHILRPRVVFALVVSCAALSVGACARTTPDDAVSTSGADTSVPVSVLAGDTPSTPTGVSGVDIVAPAEAGAVAVQSDTVATAAGDGPWSATGLVRNDTLGTVATIVVTAELVGPDGAVRDRVSAASAVHDVRPGEPVPFSLTSDVEASQVSDVRWSTVADGAGDPAARQLAVATFWTRAYGDPRPVHLGAYDETDDQRPFVAFGSLTATTSAVSHPHIVTAFADGDGRIRAVVVSPALAPDGSALVLLDPGQAGDTLVMVDDPELGPAVASWTPMIWGTRG